jgi:peptidoglycan/xylan/chitin deacetylase (PgdA/CDA1 family)
VIGLFSSRVFLGHAQLRLARRGALLLTYHRLGSPPPGALDSFLYVTPDALDEQLANLKLAGLKPARLPDFAKPGHFVVTFDDGFQSVIRHALPVLDRHGVTAIQFLVAGKPGGRNDWDIVKGDVSEPLMTDGDVHAWLAAGHEIGSHSLTHPNFRKLSPAMACEELTASKQTLEQRFGVPVPHFCYPYGAYDPATPALVREAGYVTACTVAHGVNPASADAFRLRRIVPLTTAGLLRKAVHRAFRK